MPTTFWRTFADQVRSRHPDAFLLGEVLHGDYASFAEQAGLDSVTQYELWKALGPQPARRFEAEQAAADHDGAVGAGSGGDDPLRVAEGAECVDASL